MATNRLPRLLAWIQKYWIDLIIAAAPLHLFLVALLVGALLGKL